MLVFEIPKEVQDKKVKSVTLTLVQSIPKFAKDGAIRFFLAPDLDAAGDLKFDPSAPDGVGNQIKPLHPLGSGNFKKDRDRKDGIVHTDRGRCRSGQIARGGKLCLVIVPADAAVAATYFGARDCQGEEPPAHA